MRRTSECDAGERRERWRDALGEYRVGWSEPVVLFPGSGDVAETRGPLRTHEAGRFSRSRLLDWKSRGPA